MLSVFRDEALRKKRHLLVGGLDGVAEALAAKIRADFPGANIVAAMSPPYLREGEDLDPSIIKSIEDCRADIIWIGLSAPKQELFMSRDCPVISPCLMIGVGAAFDYNIGALQRAPRWMQRHSLEWLYRLMQEPRRLASRYLKTVPRFLWMTLNSLRRYP